MSHARLLGCSPRGHGDFYLVFNSGTRSSLLCMLSLAAVSRVYSSCGAWGPLSSSGAWAPLAPSTGPRAHRHTGLVAPQYVESSGPGIEPICPTLAGRFSAPGPPENSHGDFKQRVHVTIAKLYLTHQAELGMLFLCPEHSTHLFNSYLSEFPLFVIERQKGTWELSQIEKGSNAHHSIYPLFPWASHYTPLNAK